MKLDKLLIFFIFKFIYSTVVVESYKYLGILPTNFKSHFIFGSALMKGLAQKGHQVYVISPFPLEQPIKNYHDVSFNSNLIEVEGNKKIADNYQKINFELSERILNSSNVQQLMKSNHTFDAVICETFYDEALFGFSEHFKAPLIGLSPFGNTPWNMGLVGSPSPPSYVPNAKTGFSDHMSYMERVKNFCFVVLEQIILNFFIIPRHAASYKKHFPHFQRDLYTVRKNMALLLLNSHDTLDYPRPYVSTQIAVRGMHINRHRQRLPNDIEQFIKEAEHGVIYFSMGASSGIKDIIVEKTLEIYKAFRNLKERVLWKLDDPDLEGLHNNLLIRDWFPQDEILAHENVKVFITQGGILSITESIFHAKPFIAIPVDHEQYLNMAKVKNDGIGIILNRDTFDVLDITSAVEHIVNNKSYSKSIKELSVIYRDQPMLPLDLAVYWVELVVRQKGAKYLHCAGLDLNLFAYHNIDAAIVFIIAIICAVYLVLRIFVCYI